ncbi:MAG: hypothetical protein ABI863_02100 [Ginsengibacter sp.]
MKVVLVCMLVAGALFIILKNRSIAVPGRSLSIIHPALSFSKDTISFTSQILPILVSHCSPCHFTGGKMYERLPFDTRETIVIMKLLC